MPRQAGRGREAVGPLRATVLTLAGQVPGLSRTAVRSACHCTSTGRRGGAARGGGGASGRGRGRRRRPRGRAVECRRPAKDGAQGQSGVRRGGLRWGATTVKLLGATWETGDNEVADAVTDAVANEVTKKVTARRETGQHCTAKPWSGREAGGKTQGAVTEVGPGLLHQRGRGAGQSATHPHTLPSAPTWNTARQQSLPAVPSQRPGSRHRMSPLRGRCHLGGGGSKSLSTSLRHWLVRNTPGPPDTLLGRAGRVSRGLGSRVSGRDHPIALPFSQWDPPPH